MPDYNLINFKRFAEHYFVSHCFLKRTAFEPLSFTTQDFQSCTVFCKEKVLMIDQNLEVQHIWEMKDFYP